MSIDLLYNERVPYLKAVAYKSERPPTVTGFPDRLPERLQFVNLKKNKPIHIYFFYILVITENLFYIT